MAVLWNKQVVRGKEEARMPQPVQMATATKITTSYNQGTTSGHQLRTEN